ncbi:sensor histidine kinase [Cecembia calidifontis]|jgi:signal transduction histidine kinase|uniref:histidine kinase n=1 Tax=Cecembia calidifontis TaxID=1187080 RepID=A0A4Q7P7T9_9BACT|nr:ATP-binding protein [Cecembia calidifontis]RZS95598.1 histidine kinase [Cecembia calidifontis]
MDNSGTEVFYIVLLGFILMLLMGSFIVTMVIIHRQKQLQNKQKLAALRAEYEKTIINAEKEIRENTLTHVGRELHDNIGQLLSLAKMNLSSSKPEKVSEGKSMINQIIKEVRSLSKSLNLDWVESITLSDFIQNELGKLESAAFCQTQFIKSGEEVNLDKDKKIILIRTIQECLNNAIKHAKPKNISFTMETTQEQLMICIKDDGVGFNTSQVSSGSGMFNLKNRMLTIGGNFEIKSNPGEGTDIKLSLPISNP